MITFLTDILWQMGLGSYPALDDWHQLEVVEIVLTDHHFVTRCPFSLLRKPNSIHERTFPLNHTEIESRNSMKHE